MNSLELFKNLKTTLYQLAYVSDEAKENINKIEKSLKALEIIKKKKVDVNSLIKLSKGETQYKEIASRYNYNLFLVKNERLTSKEVGLLLEILELKKDT